MMRAQSSRSQRNQIMPGHLMAGKEPYSILITNITSVVIDTDISLSVTFLEDTDLDSVPDQEEWGPDGQNNTFDG